MSDIRLKNGVPQDISHLYYELGEDGRLRWWTERQSIAGFLADVRAGKERKDTRYENIPEDQIPSEIIHASEIIYSNGKKPREGDNKWVHLHYITSSDQPEQQSTISILDSPLAEAGKDAEPKWGSGREQGNKQSQRDAHTVNGEERGAFYEDIGLSAAEFKTKVAEMRELLRIVRQRYGQGFNEADFLRERIDQGIRHLCDRDLEEWDNELIASYEDLANGWNVMAFDRYSPQMQSRELEENGYNLALHRWQGGALVRKKSAAMLDIMATAVDLPHALAEHVDPLDPNQKYGQVGFDSEERRKRDHLIKIPAIEK